MHVVKLFAEKKTSLLYSTLRGILPSRKGKIPYIATIKLILGQNSLHKHPEQNK